MCMIRGADIIMLLEPKYDALEVAMNHPHSHNEVPATTASVSAAGMHKKQTGGHYSGSVYSFVKSFLG